MSTFNLTENFILNNYSSAFLGGTLISLGTLILLLFKGRIIGISRFINDILNRKDFYWKIVFLLGMLWITTILKIYDSKDRNFFDTNEKNFEHISSSMLIIAGFLLGFGTKLAKGCSSELGVSGISRLSKLSFISKFFYLVTAIIIANINNFYNFSQNFFLIDQIIYKIFEDNPLSNFLTRDNIQSFLYINESYFYEHLLKICSTLIIMIFVYDTFIRGKNMDFEISLLSGIVFGLGIIISGMNKSRKNLPSLIINSSFDPTLEIIFLTSIIINIIFMNLIIHVFKKPIFNKHFEFPKEERVGSKIIIGSIIFGLAFGLTGICVAPAYVSLPIYIPEIFIYIIFFVLGQKSASFF